MKNWNPVLPSDKQLLSNELLTKHFGLTPEEFEQFKSEYLKSPAAKPFVYWIIERMMEKMKSVV